MWLCLPQLFVVLCIHVVLASTIASVERRSASWTSSPDEAPTVLKKDNYEADWTGAEGGRDKGYSKTKRREHSKGRAAFHYSGRTKGEERAINSAAGAGKHAVAETEGAAAKHADTASALGKDVKAKTFGFFDYRYKQPEYHVEQYYTDEKHGQKFGADHHHRAVNDHASDKHEASGWGKHGNGYLNDARGLDAHEAGAHDHGEWDNGYFRDYGNEGNKAYARGHDSYGEDYGGNYPVWNVWSRPHQDTWERHSSLSKPEQNEWAPNSWTTRRQNGWGRAGWEDGIQEPWNEPRTQRGWNRKREPSWEAWNQKPISWDQQPPTWD